MLMACRALGECVQGCCIKRIALASLWGDVHGPTCAPWCCMARAASYAHRLQSGASPDASPVEEVRVDWPVLVWEGV